MMNEWNELDIIRTTKFRDKARYSLDKNLAEKEDGKYVVYHRGKKYLIENINIEFDIEEGESFEEITKGTIGIIDIENDLDRK